MEKSKLGISLNLQTALLYFLGAIGSWGLFGMIIAAGYVLIYEESDKLKKSAVKALILAVFLTILTVIVTLLTSWLTIMIIPFTIHHGGIFHFSIPTWQAIMQSIDMGMRAISILIPVVCGLRAYNQKEIGLRWIDGIINKCCSFSNNNTTEEL